MARYDYRCPSCGNQFEVEHPMSERPQVTCPECGTVAQQVFGASSIVFKGSGFYNTDMRGKGPSSATSATSGKGSSSGSGEGSGASGSGGSGSSGSSKESSGSSTSSSGSNTSKD
ncbi:MAG: zinc ribbon domain-containing protein [Coriobacteriales bacterium]|nr:zinc ribbon domain-containing protein [Coriobacteriales bacterium]